MSRNVTYIGLAVIIVVVIAAVYFYNLGHEDLSKKSPDYILTAQELYAEFSGNENEASEKYNSMILEVNGKITGIELNKDSTYNIQLETGDPTGSVICNMDPSENSKVAELKKSQQITIRGICTGMLLDVLLNKCVIPE